MYVLNGRRLFAGLIVIIGIVLALRGIPYQPIGGIPLSLERIITMRLNVLFSERAGAIIKGEASALASHYDLGSRYGQWALEHEQRRCAYLNAWSAARGIRLVDSKIEVSIDSIEVKGTTAWIQLDESVKVTYKHESHAISTEDYLGIGAQHFLELTLKEGTWVIRRDWYSDPLDVDFSVYASLSDPFMPVEESLAMSSLMHPGPDLLESLLTTPEELDIKGYPSIYNRENAVAYADRYCGSAWGCGNNRKYNPEYKNYSGLGGDCTNFISQVLGDKEAGNLPMTYAWRYDKYGPSAGATRAWAQASSLLSYLLAGGRADRLARGTYASLIAPSETYPSGAIGALNRGDLIAYEKNGRVEHFAVVTGADSGSYLVVNSHTADRYHVPWDLGWDQHTIFWLLKIVI